MFFNFLEDPANRDVRRCYLKQGHKFLGYVKKVAGGYTYRRCDDDLWASPPCPSRETAADFLLLVAQAA